MEARECGEAVRYCHSWPHRFSIRSSILHDIVILEYYSKTTRKASTPYQVLINVYGCGGFRNLSWAGSYITTETIFGHSVRYACTNFTTQRAVSSTRFLTLALINVETLI